MGWAKYTEDNYELFYERMDAIQNFDRQVSTSEAKTASFEIAKDKPENSFAGMMKGKRCFSL